MSGVVCLFPLVRTSTISWTVLEQSRNPTYVTCHPEFCLTECCFPTIGECPKQSYQGDSNSKCSHLIWFGIIHLTFLTANKYKDINTKTINYTAHLQMYVTNKTRVAVVFATIISINSQTSKKSHTLCEASFNRIY